MNWNKAGCPWRDKYYDSAEPDQFRFVFGRYNFPGLPIRVMGDLEVRTVTDW